MYSGIFMSIVIMAWASWCAAMKKDILPEYIEKGIAALKDGALRDLDPLVGDTACQIRMAYIGDLYDRVQKGGTLTDNEKKFVGYSAALTAIKQYAVSDSVIKETLDATALGIGTKAGRRFVDTAQQYVAEGSIAYIRELAKQLPNAQHDAVNTALSITHHTELKRPIVACYPGFIPILHHVKTIQRPIVMRYDTKPSLTPKNIVAFVPNAQGVYKPVNPADIDEKRAVFAIDAVSIAKSAQSIESANIEESILTDASTHPLFAGKINSAIDLPYCELGIESLKKDRMGRVALAESLGVTRKNPTLFSMDHIFAATMKEFAIKKTNFSKDEQS